MKPFKNVEAKPSLPPSNGKIDRTPFTRRFLWPASKKISVREKMTDDNKKTPTDDKITELSAWQKKTKEYLEKKSA